VRLNPSVDLSTPQSQDAVYLRSRESGAENPPVLKLYGAPSGGASGHR
jgi:hypothetical protein